MPNTPTSILYHGRPTSKDKDGKKIWTRIGAVWANKSGKGFNLTWDYLPLGDGLTVMLPFDKVERLHLLRYSISRMQQIRLLWRAFAIPITATGYRIWCDPASVCAYRWGQCDLLGWRYNCA
jgi:hypothetical protein